MSIAIEIEHLSKKYRLHHERNQYLKTALLRRGRARYEEFWAVRDVSFDISSGSTFGIIGSNGSGKSTLLKCLAGILTPDEGRIKIEGRVAALLELGSGFHPELTGRENVFLNGAILGMTQREIAHRLNDIIDFSGLAKFIDTPVKNFSSGMVVRLGFAIATNVEPEILLIDEVLAVGDAEFQQRCYEKIEKFRSDGRTIVIVSHGLGQIEQMCDRVAWLEHSHLKEIGPAFETVQRYSGSTHHSARHEEGAGERWGSGEVTISEVEILSNGMPARVLTTNQNMTIRIRYEAHVPVTDAVVGVRITHLHGLNVWGTNTKRKAVRLSQLSGAGTIDLEIPRLGLLEGTFDLTVAISDSAEVNAYDHWEKMIRFDVQQSGSYDEGLVALDGTWTH